jgi:preprotein translocase subunit SecB
MNEKTMKLNSFQVLNFAFEAVPNSNNSPTTLPVGTKISNAFQKIDASTAKVFLKAEIGDFAKPKPPYSLSVSICGTFEFPNFETDPNGLFFMKNNTISILYPYLRSLVSQITSLSGFPVINLPIINTVEVFGDQVAKSKLT